LCRASLPKGVQTAIRKFSTEQNFLKTVNPKTQIRICAYTDVCLFGDYPTLADLSLAFSKNTPVVWLVPQLFDLSEYCGCKEKLTKWQLEQCATIIAQTYSFLKITEIMLFFYQFKQAKYGKFYGAVDPLTIMTSLKDFVVERNDAYRRKEQEEREKAENKSKKESITWEEYCKRNIKDRKNPFDTIKL